MQKGLQLIELMIVVAIVGVLAVVAFPNYNRHVATAHRLQAQQLLLQVATKLEQYQIKHGSYQGATVVMSDDDYYRYRMQIDEQSYLLSAVPKKNDECGVLVLDSNGWKGNYNPGLNAR